MTADKNEEREEGQVSDAPEPPRAEEVVDDDDLVLKGSLESIEGYSASPDPEDPGDPSPDRKP